MLFPAGDRLPGRTTGWQEQWRGCFGSASPPRVHCALLRRVGADLLVLKYRCTCGIQGCCRLDLPAEQRGVNFFCTVDVVSRDHEVSDIVWHGEVWMPDRIEVFGRVAVAVIIHGRTWARDSRASDVMGGCPRCRANVVMDAGERNV